MTTANKITLARVALVPIFMIFLLMESAVTEIVALIIFVVASATDGIDGYIARKYNQITDFGKFIDPLADKLLVTAAIIIFVERGQMWSWAAMIIITREFAVTALRLVAANSGTVIAAAMAGKIKTVVSIVAICIMMTPLRFVELGPIFVNDLMVILMTAVTVWSGIEYFYKNRKVLSVM